MAVARRLDYCNTASYCITQLSNHRGQSHCRCRLAIPSFESQPGTSGFLQHTTGYTDFIPDTVTHLTETYSTQPQFKRLFSRLSSSSYGQPTSTGKCFHWHPTIVAINVYLKGRLVNEHPLSTQFSSFIFSALMPLVGWQEGYPACKTLSGGVLVWLSVWSEVQTCMWPSWCHCHSLSLASVKSRLVLPFWYRLTWVVLDKGPLNGCVYLFRKRIIKDEQF